MVVERDNTEKITLNVGLVDLGQIDLLVQEGFYANRTDFFRAAARRQIAGHGGALHDAVARKTLTLGVLHLTRAELERHREEGSTLQVRVLGLATIAPDVSPELAAATIESVEVLGAFRADPAVKVALAERTARGTR